MRMIPYSRKGQRFGALILDNIIISFIIGIIVGIASGSEDFSTGLIGGMMTGEMIGAMKLYMITTAIVNFLYFSLFECGKKHATLGKRVAKIKVADVSGASPKTLDVFVRNAIKILPTLLPAVFTGGAVTGICSIAGIVYYIVPICNKQGRAIHDFIAGTAVIQADYVHRENIQQVCSQDQILSNPLPLGMEDMQDSYSFTQIPQFASTNRKLVGISGEYEGARFPLDEPLILGRMRNSCNVIFSEEAKGVSRVHCKIGVENGQVYVEDLGSSHGVKVNGSRQLSAHQRTNLDIGNVIMIGRYETFKIE